MTIADMKQCIFVFQLDFERIMSNPREGKKS